MKPHPVNQLLSFTIKLNAVLALTIGFTSALAIPAVLAILFVASPFVSDRQEDQIKVLILPFARMLGSSLVWGTGVGLLGLARSWNDINRLMNENEAKVEPSSSGSKATITSLPVPQACYFCTYYSPSAALVLEHPCVVHPTKPEAGWFCPDYDCRADHL